MHTFRYDVKHSYLIFKSSSGDIICTIVTAESAENEAFSLTKTRRMPYNWPAKQAASHLR
jgi:hypothetical protein